MGRAFGESVLTEATAARARRYGVCVNMLPARPISVM